MNLLPVPAVFRTHGSCSQRRSRGYRPPIPLDALLRPQSIGAEAPHSRLFLYPLLLPRYAVTARQCSPLHLFPPFFCCASGPKRL